MPKVRTAQQSFDIDYIRSAARGRWSDIARSVLGIGDEFLSGSHGPCPKCHGNDRWRVFADFGQTGGAICNQCGHDIGDGFALVRWMLGIKFGEALKRVADYLGVEPAAASKSSRKKNADPAEHLKFLDWHEGLAETWCVLHKPGIRPAAMLAAGGKLARYRDQHTVFAFPVWGPKLTMANPVGWCLYNVSGGPLPRFSKGDAVKFVKTKLTHGSQPGLIGQVDQLAAATTVWKTEGPTDLLALLSLDLPTDVAAVTNANGAGERPAAWMLELFAGKNALVVHDADQPGERGAAGYDAEDGKHRPGWVEAIATRAQTCRHVRLPHVIEETHGKDLRDWLVEGHSYADLAALAADVPAAAQPAAQLGPAALESDDDPHRLARMNLERYATHAAGATLRYWRDEWYTWKPSRGCYREIPTEELRTKLNWSIKKEFDRINIEQQSEAWREDPPTAQKVTKTLVTNVLDATKSLTIVPSSVEMMSWLDGQQRQRRNYVAMANGILDLDRLLNDDTAELADVLLPHSPSWFSPVCLPYDFDLEAKCPRWERFLETSLEMDPERIKILQEWAGYLLLPDSSQQKFLSLEGEGSNGKGVYIAGMTAMLGIENCSYISIDLVGDKFVRTETIGKLVNICPDAGEIDKASEGDFKSFVSGDVMFFGRKFIQTGLNCAPTARMMIAFNNRPRFSDKSSGIWRRILSVPFTYTVPEIEKNKRMADYRFWNESGELPGVLLWAIAGLHRLRAQNKFTESESGDKATEDWRIDDNPARGFLVEHLEADPIEIVRCGLLYKIYKYWAETYGYRPMGERLFGKEVKRVFKNSERVQRGVRGDREWHYRGIGFTQDKICGHQTIDQALF